MNFSTIISVISLLLVGAFFILNTGSTEVKKDGGSKVEMKDGKLIQVGTIVLGKKYIDYKIFTYDYGVHWWAIKKIGTVLHIEGTAEEIYPGLLKALNDPIHAQIALQSFQENNKKKSDKSEDKSDNEELNINYVNQKDLKPSNSNRR